ncbi:MAG: glycosyltransferase [Cyanobacteria bacterium]|nr:glycosyltransferase [Cyanobacteriota bacterium]
MDQPLAPIGVVIIGRNEGERLIRCLKSAIAQIPAGSPLVYVDSGSTDGSAAAARDLGVRVIDLDLSVPFTMPRGRNAGFEYLTEQFPQVEYVQFIDGDCELLPGWIDRAFEAIQQEGRIAIVCGRRREKFPEASVYNRLAEMEWNTPVGEAKYCGGDILARVAALREVGAYDPTMICGEEPEMCIRLRSRGWRIRRIDADMTLHDAAMLRFGQWWTRSVRGGWAVAEGFDRYGASDERYMVQEHKSGWIWGAIVPLVAIALAWPSRGLSFVLLLGYGYLGWRIYQYRRRFGDGAADARLYAIYCTISKFPQLIGQIKYWLTRWRGRTATLIEYK